MEHPLSLATPIASTHGISSQDLLLLAPLVLISLALIVAALIDLYRRDAADVRGNRPLWTIVILVVSTFGPIAYFIFGRKER
jgi:hypothetical protein